MKKTPDDKNEQRKRQFTEATEKLKGAAAKEQHNAIANLLATGDEFSQSLVLFDIMTDTDTIESLLIRDEIRIKALCDFYKVKLSPAVKELLLNNLKQCRRSRRANVLKQSGVQKEREAFVFELAKRYSLSQNRYKQK